MWTKLLVPMKKTTTQRSLEKKKPNKSNRKKYKNQILPVIFALQNHKKMK